MSQQVEVLSQEFELGFTYTRSTGPVVGRFLTGLRDRQIVGNKGSDGKVYVPPIEYDPVTAAPGGEFVELADEGVVVNWAWVSSPSYLHHLQNPFAFALVKPDGADVPMLHMVDAGSEDKMSTGMRVKVRWADDTKGFITDIVCFDPV